MRLIRTRLLAFLAATFVALPALGFSGTSYACQITGRVASTCCCADKHVAEPSGAEAKAPDCCEVTSAHAHESAPTVRTSVEEFAPATCLVAVALAPIARDPNTHSRGPARVRSHAPGPPRFLSHCAFLI